MKLQSTGMFAAAMIWGTWVLILSGVSLPGYFVTAITSFTGFLGLLAYVFATKKGDSLFAILRNRKLLQLIVAVALLEAVQNALFLIAFKLAISGGGSVFIPIIRAFIGIITALLAIGIDKKEFSVRYLLYGVLSTLGAIIIFSWEGLNAEGRISYLGLTLVIASVIISGIQYIVQRIMALEMSAVGQQETNVVTYQALLSGIFLLPLIIYYFFTSQADTTGLLPQLAYIGIFGFTHVALAFVLRLNALRYITAQQGVIIGYLEQITSITISILFLKEQISIGYVIGAALIIGSAIAAGLHSAQTTQSKAVKN